MIFNHPKYIIFFLVVYLLYVLLPRYKWQNFLLLAASYFFYTELSFKLFLLIGGYTLSSYVLSHLIQRSTQPRTRKLFLTLGVLSSIGTLCLFKYMNFAIDSVTAGLAFFGLQANISTLSIILPVGISFYTFQCLGYLIDIYRSKYKPADSLSTFALFVAFFPQLVAGPIERASNLMPQLTKARRITGRDLKQGLLFIAVGYFLKSVIADTLDPLVGFAFDFAQPDHTTGVTTLLGVFAFGIEIYCDFAGYSLIAIGSARLMGIRLMSNFRNPYLALSPQDFWHRWHISLSTWIRDYLYFSIGGSRVDTWRAHSNLLFSMAVCGLWHGANWNFILWGLYHGLLLVSQRALQGTGVQLNVLTKWVVTFLLINIGWFIFRVKSYDQATQMLENIFGNFTWQPLSTFYLLNVITFSTIVLFQHRVEEKYGTETWSVALSPFKYWVLIGVAFFAVMVTGLNGKEFIYFRF